MFDFEKLEVYKKAVFFYKEVILLLAHAKPDSTIRSQLKRAALSISLNIAEGSSRFGNKDRKAFFVIARGSAFECAAILNILKMDHASYSEILDIYKKMRNCQLFSMS